MVSLSNSRLTYTPRQNTGTNRHYLAPRLNEGIRQGLQILVTARESMSKDRPRLVNALNALVRSNDLSIDARRKLTPVQIGEISRWQEC